MNKELTSTSVEKLLLQGDLSSLTPEQKLMYYKMTCDRVGLDPMARPFDYLNLKGKLVLYANKGCAEQLRSVHKVSLSEPQTQVLDGTFVVTVVASLPCGRTDGDMGSVPIDNLKGEARSNAMLKAVTKAKRRATLSIVGLGMLDETEVDTIPGAQVVTAAEAAKYIPHKLGTKEVVTETGEVVEASYPLDGDSHDPYAEEEIPLHLRDAKYVDVCMHKEKDGREWWSILLRHWSEDRETGEKQWVTTFSTTIAADASSASADRVLVHGLIEANTNSSGRTFYNLEELELCEMSNVPDIIKKGA